MSNVDKFHLSTLVNDYTTGASPDACAMRFGRAGVLAGRQPGRMQPCSSHASLRA